MNSISSSIGVAMLAVSTLAAAAAQRTFVASNGVDANPCSLTQPCRTFGTAIGQTVAGGEVIVLDSAGYGIVTITKSVSIIAPPGIYAGISVLGSQTGITINAASATVVLRGLTINGVGGTAGISFVQGSRLRIEGCVVANVSGAGIVQQAPGSEMTILDTVVRDNGGAGVIINADASMLLDTVRVEHNGGDGVFIASVATGADATIRNSALSYNGQAGVAATMQSTPANTRVVVESSVLSQNGGDGVFAGGGSDGQILGVISRNVISGNGLSGISAFNLVPSQGVSSIDAFANTFSKNGDHAIKVDGFPSQVFMSRNHFAHDAPSLLKVGGGFLGTYGDNTGGGGTGLTLQSPF